MTVKTLIELLQKCPQDNIVIYEYMGEILGLDDVLLGSGTNRGFTYLSGADSEERTGQWIPQDHNERTGHMSTAVYYLPKCSECGRTGDFNMNFCPNCGARMVSE